MIYSSIDLSKPQQTNREQTMNPEQIFALLQNIADQKETPDIDPNVLKKLKEIAAKFKSEEIDEQQALRQAMQLFFPDEK